MQVGLGMELSSINTDHTGGAITGTGVETDLAIEGSGFFVVSDGNREYYTRDGSFVRDANGYLVNANGLRLMGWMADRDGVIDSSGERGAIHIPLGEEMIAGATSEVFFAGNLDSGTDNADSCEFSFHAYDSLGNRHDFVVTFTKDSDGNDWDYEFYVYIYDDDGNLVKSDDGITGSDDPISFDEYGKYVGDPDDEISFTYDAPAENGAAELEIAVDFSALTQLAETSEVIAKEQDGFKAGELVTFNIDENGFVTGTYSNGMSREIAQVALASFANPMGLVKMGSNLYNISSNSGEARIGEPGKEGRGTIQSRSLEMSNVDLANEFTEMITTSRAFQANTRVISTSDEVLLELINIKR